MKNFQFRINASKKVPRRYRYRTYSIFATSTTLAGLLIMVYMFLMVGYLLYSLMLSWMCTANCCDDVTDAVVNDKNIVPKIIETYINQRAAVRIMHVGSMMTLSSLIVSTVCFFNFCLNLIRMPHTALDWIFYTITNVVYLMFFAYILNYCNQFPEKAPHLECTLLLYPGFNNTHVLSICNWHQTLSFALVHYAIFAYSREEPLYVGIRKLMCDRTLRREGPLGEVV